MQKIILKIDGMVCGMCEAHINDAIRNSFSVGKVTSSRKKGLTEIITEEDISDEALKEAIGGIGYTLLSVERKLYG